MSANTNVARANPESMSLAHLSDAQLLMQTRSLVGRSNRLLAELLAHLGEVEARGVHRTRACSSLYTYLIYELRFSEDEAFRRVAAARLVRRFPALLDAIAAGELHLTGLLMLGPHLTAENVVEVLARAKHRTKREIARLVRVLDPLPSVPARIEPLGPAPRRLVPPAPTWEQFVSSLNPVRELEVGERPREWGLDERTGICGTDDANDANDANGSLSTADGGSLSTADGHFEIPAPASPARLGAEGLAELSGPQRYQVVFTATEEYVRLVQEAKALLSHHATRATFEDIQLRALRAFVEKLRQRKYGSKEPSAGATHAADVSGVGCAPAGDEGESLQRPPSAAANRIEVARASSEPRRRGRYIPAAERRAVAARDGHRCSYVDAAGRRCLETRRLEFHHLVPFAVSPSHDAANLTLRCQAHNALAAEQDFGRDVIDERRSAGRHDSFSKQGP